MIGNNLKNIREKLGLGVNELSRISDVNASYISSIERGVKTNPSIEILEKIANALDVEVKELFETENVTDEKLQQWDNELSENGELVKQIKTIEFINSPEDAIRFILKQPILATYGGYDLNTISEKEIMSLADDMLLAMKISIEKMNIKSSTHKAN